MLRGLRFLVFSTFVVVALARNAAPLKRALGLATSTAYFAPHVPNVTAALAALAVVTAYAIWLAQATFAGRRMPLWPHAVPSLALILTQYLGPLPMSPVGDGTASDRAVAAMSAVAARLEGEREPCRADLAAVERELVERAPPTGFHLLGFRIPFRVAPRPAATGPVLKVEGGQGVGTIYLACDPGGRRFWLSAVVTDALPHGEPTMLKDGVGKVAVVSAEGLP
ncbi:MAG TPA: hypothetical protein VGK67_22540 [Myxococcales bacterium]|jgi:hypothetical protein